MNKTALQQFVGKVWDDSIVPCLVDYIRIPNKSPLFDPAWQENGHMQRAVELIEGWCREQPIEGMTIEVVTLEGRTPLIYMEIPGETDDTVLLYGHLDKQPEMVGWHEGLGPWEPVLRGDKLYGRGGADDGYAAFGSLTAIRALREQGGKHARCVVLIEGCEESGSYDLPFYIDHLADRIGQVSFVICLDSGCGNYDQLWCTTSLRGIVSGNLDVHILESGVHSGDASGVVPSSFRIARQLLSRLENENTGRILPKDFWVDIPKQRVDQAAECARVLGEFVHERFPWVDAAHAVDPDPVAAVLARTWQPALSITGAAGLPSLDNAGNVLRPFTSLKVSLRIPPMVDPARATEALKRLLEQDPPYGARVTFDSEQGAAGWNAPEFSPWLLEAAQSASQAYFGKEAVYMGEGGTIPFMGMLGEKFPAAQFFITGVLGPESNAHGPNEFLHIPMGKRLTCCVAQLLADHLAASS
ncbi:MAG: M20 family metallopeptidase [Planctomycetes bacterium]|nr:M20 family metallopeptidase [Planctomycetota bacterium]MCB9889702.1 M20 family metallopeptidase [Planctomycetota bacterium]